MRRVLVVALVACHGARPPAPLPVTTTATFATVAADQVVEEGDLVYVLGPDKITIARGDRATTVVPLRGPGFDPHRTWTSAASIAALDGDGRWIVATRIDGTLWRIHRDGELEPIGDRFGLGNELVIAVAGHGSTTALGLEHGTAVTTDGVHLAHYPTAPSGPIGRLAVARDRIAIATEHAVEIWDLRRNTSQRYELADALPTFLDADSPASRLVVRAGRDLWLERGGTLHRIGPRYVFPVVASGSRLWARLADDRRQALFVLDGDAFVPTTAKIVDGSLFASPSGDVWVNVDIRSSRPTYGVALQRFSLDRAVDPRWQADVAPVFERVCAHCHLPGGDADFDLSTAAAWRQARDAIRQRVLVERTMPPAGTTLTDADRDALASWLSR